MKSKKLLLLLLLSLSVLTGIFAGNLFSGKIKAAEEGRDYTLTIQKVCEAVDPTSPDCIEIDEEKYDIVQTHTASDNVFILKESNKNNKKEYLLVSFNKIGNAGFLNLSVAVKLTNADGTFNISSLERTSTEQKIEYNQLFDLTNTYELDTSSEDGLGTHFNEYDAQGYYTFTFTFNISDNYGFNN